MGTQRRPLSLISLILLSHGLLPIPLWAADSGELEQKAYRAYTSSNYSQAIRYYQELLKLRPTDAEIYYNLGVVYQYNKEPAQAIAAYQQAIALNPEYLDAYNNLGVAYVDTKSWDRAIEIYRYLLRFRSEDPDVWYNLGVCYSQSNMPHKAQEAWQKALNLQPTHSSARAMLEHLEKTRPSSSATPQTSPPGRPQEAIRQYEHGNRLKSQKRWKEAIQAYKNAISLDPRFSEAHYQLGWIYNQTGSHHAALAALVQAIALVPTHVSAHHQMALSYEHLGQTGKALEVLNNLLMIRADYLPALYDLGRLYEENRNPEQAIRIFEQLSKQDKNYSDTLYRLGKLHLQQNNPDLAEAYFHESTRLKPGFIPAWIQLGKMAWQSGQTEKAQTYFNQALSLAPQNAELHYTLANLYFQQGDASALGRSQAYLNQALALQPGYTDALALRGVMHYNSRNYPLAIQDFQTALNQDKQRADLQRNLGLAYTKNGQADPAISALETYLRLEPAAADAAQIRKLIQELKILRQKKSSR